jgi:hypothetical protein
MDGLGRREPPFLKCSYSILDARSALLLLVYVGSNYQARVTIGDT